MRLPNVLALAVAALSVAAGAAYADGGLALAEHEYADWLDATSAVSTIDSGLMPRVDGRNRARWDKRRLKLQAQVAHDLRGIDKSALRDEDARALAAMLDGLVVNALDASQSAPGIEAAPRCADRGRV